VKHLLQKNSPLDLCVTKDSINKQRHTNENLFTSQLTGKTKKFFKKKIFFCFLFQDFFNKVEKSTTNGQYDTKDMKPIITKHSHTSPILHRLLTSPKKLNEISIVNNQNEPIDNENNKSPQYRPRYSPFYVPEIKNNTTFISKDNFNRISKTSRQSCRSFVFTR